MAQRLGLSTNQWGDIGFGLRAGSSLFSAYGDYEEGQQAAGAYDYNAELALNENQFNQTRMDQNKVEFAAAQRAGYAKAGVENSGSALDVQLKTAANFELDKAISNYNAQSRAAMYEYKAQQAQQAGTFNAGRDLLTGAASLAFMFA